MKKSIGLLAVLLFASIIPLLMHLWIGRIIAYYDHLASMYECQSSKCVADFDGDGVKGELIINKDQGFVLVQEKSVELMRIPYSYIDNSYRTRLALDSFQGKTRLIVYDGTYERDHLTKAVYEWDGSKMAETKPSSKDSEITTAFALQDDSGWWNIRSLYYLIAKPAFAVYEILVIVMLIYLYLHSTRSSKSSDLIV